MKKFMRILVPVLMVALVIASIGWYLFDYDREFTRDMLLQQARYHDLSGNSRLSSWFYNLAYQHSGQDQNVAIELANQYIEDGNYTKAEVTLSNAINREPTVELYTALSKAYVDQDKLMDAISLMNLVSDPVLKAELETMRPEAPVPDHAPDFYSQHISISFDYTGTLYCTTDGRFPSVEDAPCVAPIELPVGETRIYAVSVMPNGLVSPLTLLSYTVGGIVEPAVFKDPAVESAVRDLVDNRPGKPVYTSAMWEITEFTYPAAGVSLDDLALMTNLETLIIHDKTIDDLSVLTELPRLKTLDLSGCRFPASELAIIAKLTELTDLDLSDCGLSTINALEGAKKLSVLKLGGNTVRNLEVLSPMETLTRLELQHNAVVALDALSTLPNLAELDISYNAVTTLAPIGTCLKLSKLTADGNQIAAIEGISSLPLLSKLSLEQNQLTDITPLGECVELTELSLANNSITDISCLAPVKKLEIFDFAYNSVTNLPAWPEDTALRLIDGAHNQLTSIDVLGTMADVTYVYMDYNQLTNVDALANCFHLVQVNVYGNEIEDVSELTVHNIIVNYNPAK